MKKILSILLVLVMVFGLTACGGPKPEDTVKAFCDSMKAFDFDGMQAHLVNKLDEDQIIGEEVEEMSGFVDYMKSCASLMTYSVGKASVNGDSATVPVEFKFKDSTDFVKDLMKELFAKLFEIMFSGEDMSDEEAESLISDMIMQKSPAELPDTTASVNFTLQKVDKDWKVKELTEDMANILTSNMVKAMDSIDEEDLGLDEDWGEDMFSWGTVEPIEYDVHDEVIYDDEYLTLTVLNGGADEWGAPYFEIAATNNTADKNLTIDINSASVNGWNVSSFFYGDTAPGETVTDTLFIGSDTLEMIGVDEPDEVRLFVTASEYDEENWENVYFVNDSAVFYPTGLSASDIPEAKEPEGSNKMVVLDDEIAKYVILEGKEGEYDNYSFKFYIENRSEQTITFSWDGCEINGQEADLWFSETVPAGQKRLCSDGFFFENLKSDGLDIDTVESLAFTMYGTGNDWMPLFEDVEVYYEP